MQLAALIGLLVLALVPPSAEAAKEGTSQLSSRAPGHILPREHLRSSWGKQLNPTGAVPASGFKAIYFNRDHPREAVFQEDVDSIAIKYAWSDFHQIPSPHFAAYWVGRLEYASETVQRFSVSQSWAKARIIIDGAVVFDENSRDDSFEHRFAPGAHVVEVEYVNNWHTVGFKVTIEDIIKPLTEEELAEYLQAKQVKPIDLYYVGLYESGRRDASVDVTVPRTRRPAVVWLTSYEAIDWKIGALAPGSTVVISSHSAGSRARGPGIERVFHLGGVPGIYDATKACSCTSGIYHCEQNEDLEYIVQRLGAVTGMNLSGFALKYSASTLLVQPYDDRVARHILEQREENEAARAKCVRDADPNFDTLMDERATGEKAHAEPKRTS